MALFSSNLGTGRKIPNPDPAPSLDLVRELHRLEVRASGLVDSLSGGDYASVFHGRGFELSHVREYQIGDDGRSIDWKVTARRGVPHVREFVAERDLLVVLLVDVSASSRYSTGSRSVMEVATEISAALAFAAVRNNDRVALILVSDMVESVLPAGSGRRHAIRLLTRLLTHRTEGRGTDLGAGMDGLLRMATERVTAFVISDFLPGEADPLERTALLKLSHRHHVVAVRVTSPEAETIPDVGWVHWTDPETGRRVLTDTGSPDVRERFRQDLARDRANVVARLGEAGVDLLEVDTNSDPLRVLSAFLRRLRIRAF